MQCPRCQHQNPSQAKFCEECATPLVRTCANCGTQLSPRAKFCPECAHPLAAGTAPQPRSRWNVTEWKLLLFVIVIVASGCASTTSVAYKGQRLPAEQTATIKRCHYEFLYLVLAVWDRTTCIVTFDGGKAPKATYIEALPGAHQTEIRVEEEVGVAWGSGGVRSTGATLDLMLQPGKKYRPSASEIDKWKFNRGGWESRTWNVWIEETESQTKIAEGVVVSFCREGSIHRCDDD